MLLYKELNFPCPIASNQQIAKILAKINFLKQQDKSYTTILTGPEDYLHPDLLDIFKSVGVVPQFIAVFGLTNSQIGLSTLHADITFKNNKWTKMPFGINCDLTPGDAIFNWWDTGDCPGLYPDPAESEFPPQVNGIHHKTRGNKDTSDFKLIDSYKIKFKQPVLFRTDVPHQISYTTSVKQRVCISIRFSPDDIATWERALEIFQPFAKE